MKRCLGLLLLLTAACPTTRAEDFRPDPRSVQRWGSGYRYPQDGWIVLHIEGEPYERGVQHGRLLAPEIAAHVRCFATVQSPKSPADGWRHVRTLANALFLRRYEREYLEEMKGIADGASAAGARFGGRPLDLLDVVALNSWPEVETLPGALDALPTGLEAVRFPLESAKPKAGAKPMHCSAFAATGPATADGKVVFGHITMFGLYPSSFYNVWLDVKPARGHRVFMQTYPAGIQSGLDYYFNDAGLLVSETTIDQTRFDPTGLTVASRIRQALQYGGSIDEAVAILGKANNGLYTNEWLLADINTNEIAMFELGTHKSHLYRSSKGEWFGGTEGFYWGCNNVKDLQVRLETVASVEGRPADATFRCSDRDCKWLQLYDRYKGKMDASFGKVAFGTPPLAAYHSVDAKFTTTDMARQLKTWALFGPPLGRAWQPTFQERKRYPDVQPLVSNPWTVLHAAPPPEGKASGAQVVDLHRPQDGKVPLSEERTLAGIHGRRAAVLGPSDDFEDGDDHDDGLPPTRPAWFGTLLLQSDADTWLATAYADYEHIVALEQALREKSKDGLSRAEKDELATELFRHRASYELGARAHPEVPLARTESRLRDSDWYRVASGKGVLLLYALRRRIGDEAFLKLMDRFGREYAGKAVSTGEFRAAAEKAAPEGLEGFFDEWLNRTGLPAVRGDSNALGADALTCGPFSVLTFFAELEKTLIVYGTAGEKPTNREAAHAMQQALRERGPNITVPVKADDAVTDDELKSHHLMLIGRPETNTLVARFAQAWPVRFGPHSFEVRGQAFAHPDSAVVAAGENPLARRFSAVVFAGLGAASTLRTASLESTAGWRAAEVIVLPHGGTARSFVVGNAREAHGARDGKAADRPRAGG
jgi:hypothetical protein